MKKVLGIVMVLMMVVGLMVPVFGSAESVKGHSSMYVYCANGKRLNVREEPSRNSNLLFRLENGSKVTHPGRCRQRMGKGVQQRPGRLCEYSVPAGEQARCRE